MKKFNDSFFCVVLLAAMFSCVGNSSVLSGDLPEEYKWVYGTWRFSDGNIIKVEGDLVYTSSLWEKEFDLFPFYAQPGQKYDFYTDEDELTLLCTGYCGIEFYLSFDILRKAMLDAYYHEFINEKNPYAKKVRVEYNKHTLDSCNELRKKMEEEMRGDWRNVNYKTMDDEFPEVRIKIDDDYWKDNVYYVSRNGFFVDIEGNILVYDKEKDELIIKYLRIEEESEEGYVYLDETYRRYDPNQERLE